MIKVSIKTFLHNFAKYKDKAKTGERIVVCEHKTPILDVIPHQEKITRAGWKRDHFILPKGKSSATKSLIKDRREGRH